MWTFISHLTRIIHSKYSGSNLGRVFVLIWIFLMIAFSIWVAYMKLTIYFRTSDFYIREMRSVTDRQSIN